ncbi:hypothetical protein F7725_024602 [Dissostichus mawsoni]|uniref:Uncharacterized protein n=1 Tax=Dissostichus mawsoni TaxID=36200 RepID=A0A7J5XAG2_DISMA|nr:hypothetical protein F7725_024602 [Dissostichus mawsoni]
MLMVVPVPRGAGEAHHGRRGSAGSRGSSVGQRDLRGPVEGHGGEHSAEPSEKHPDAAQRALNAPQRALNAPQRALNAPPPQKQPLLTLNAPPGRPPLLTLNAPQGRPPLLTLNAPRLLQGPWQRTTLFVQLLDFAPGLRSWTSGLRSADRKSRSYVFFLLTKGSRDAPVNSKGSRDAPVNSKGSRDAPVNSKGSRDAPVNSKGSWESSVPSFIIIKEI